MNREIVCPWQKIIKTEKTLDKKCGVVISKMVTIVSFGKCLSNCPFCDSFGQSCKRGNF